LFSYSACTATARHERSRPLAVVAPKSIAVVGAGERATSSGGAIMQMLHQAGYGGRAVPVNPKGGMIFGYESVTSIARHRGG
jgi:acyl-CoA synthetase (NDP forming)